MSLHATLFRPAPAIALLVALSVTGAAEARQSIVPEAVAPSSAVLDAASAAYLTADERSAFRVLHGIYDDTDLDTVERRARVALERWQLDDAALSDPALPAMLRLHALTLRGAYREILDRTADVASGAQGLPAQAARAMALAMLDRKDEALALAAAPSARLALGNATTIADILAAVDLGALRIRLDASAAGTYQSLLAALARARQEIDRLDPRVRLREAELLAERHAMSDAVRAVGESLALAPRSAAAWRLAGDLSLDQFDFDGAARASAAIRRIAALHPFAAYLDARSALLQDDPETALEALAPVLNVTRPDVAANPPPYEALAWKAASEASRYDFQAMRETLAEADRLAPGSAAALVIAGRQIAFDRQYEEARATLDTAAAREPAWAIPRAELGLLSMQDGREARAVEDLRAAVALDPNDERTLFTLALAEQLAGWKRIETRHFVIRHPDGDAALVAKLLAGVLDEMHESICARLGHEPAQRTLIDVMPDHRSFGVRITGLPRIHTIAVCTGPTIAIEIPKDGAQKKHLGLFDPLAVLRHEYTHTVTLSMTRNRIPHWLTEAVAVALEDTPRTFETCQMLASAWRRGALFDLDGINWAFVRPKRPTDRAQAYAQGRWMVEYAQERFGWEAMRKLLFSYAEGIREDDAMRRAFSIGRDEFFTGFVAWAGDQIRAWGMDPQPSLRTLALELVESDEAELRTLKAAERARLAQVAQAWSNAIGTPSATRFSLPAREWPAEPSPSVDIDDASLRAFLVRYPEHADLVEILLRRARSSGAEATEATRALLERYATLRPVDPLPHRMWSKLASSAEDALDPESSAAAFRHLSELDLRSDKDNVFAIAIARNRRAIGDLPAASAAAERAVRMNPFDPTVRELAAAIAVEANRLDRAETHIEALVVLEPEREIHRQRLARIRELRVGGATK